MKPTNRRTQSRRLRVESLEKRRLLAGDYLTNNDMRSDVNGDQIVSALDALTVINHMVKTRAGEGLSAPSTELMLDVNADGNVSAVDALNVINDLMRIEASQTDSSTNNVTDPNTEPTPDTASGDLGGGESEQNDTELEGTASADETEDNELDMEDETDDSETDDDDEADSDEEDHEDADDDMDDDNDDDMDEIDDDNVDQPENMDEEETPDTTSPESGEQAPVDPVTGIMPESNTGTPSQTSPVPDGTTTPSTLDALQVLSNAVVDTSPIAATDIAAVSADQETDANQSASETSGVEATDDDQDENDENTDNDDEQEIEFESRLTGGAGEIAKIEYEMEIDAGIAEMEFEVKVKGALPDSVLDVLVAGLLVGQVTTDANGSGELELSNNPDSDEVAFPADFPMITAGVLVSVGSNMTGMLQPETDND